MCYCGATDCPSCGRAQGYIVKRRPSGGYYNPVYCMRCEDEEVSDQDELCPECRALEAEYNEELAK